MIVDFLTTEDELVEICSDYWALKDDGQFAFAVSELTTRYGITTKQLLKLVSSNSVARSKHLTCSSCEQPYQFKSRSDFKSFAPVRDFTCDRCVDELTKRRENGLRDWLRRNADKNSSLAILVENLNVRDAAYLLAVVRHSAAEDLSKIAPIETDRNRMLSPRVEFDREILLRLYTARILLVSPSSKYGAFHIDDDDNYSFDPLHVAWSVASFWNANDLGTVIQRLETSLKNTQVHDGEPNLLKELARKLSLMECVNFLELAVRRHKLPFSVGEKTKLVLSQVLEHLSVAQTYSFIWRAAKDAAAYYMRSGVHRKRAAHSIVGNIQGQLDRALSYNWDVKPFRRNFDLQQSVLSQVVFNTIFRTDDGGFSEPIWKLFNAGKPPR